MALALYRRYRPDTFDGVIGQDQVTIPLSRALDQGKITHAYLFSGPRGCGKTSSARILARCINCEKGPTSHPCGQCQSCKDLATGGAGSIDVVEIDAASHNGVDDARELRERAGFAPARDRYKIFILDEAHMVTPQGFNALLKIVEEPPEHVMFIFATTEPDKVIGTIRSRTHHYPFRLVPPEVMGPYLEDVCKKENIVPAPGVLRLAMRAGSGSVRDTLSVLDQLMVGAIDGAISLDSAVALLGFTPSALIGEAVDALIEHNGAVLYDVVRRVVVGGYDTRKFVEDLLGRVRDLLLMVSAGQQAALELLNDIAPEDLESLQKQATKLTLPDLASMAQTINAALSGLAASSSPRMNLEILMARLLADAETKVAVSGDRFVSSQSTQHNHAENKQASAPATRGSHFIGSQRNQTTSRTEPTSPVVTNPSATVAQVPAEQLTQHNVSESSPEPVQSVQPAQPARSVDEMWDAVVAKLPEDSREYVTRQHVPTVQLSDPQAGRQRLVLTFNEPMSQHAFALAVCTTAPYDGQKVPKVVMNVVREIFGANVMIAPAPMAANGEAVESVARMDPQKLAQVKRDILLRKTGITAGFGGKTASDSGGDEKAQAKETQAKETQAKETQAKETQAKESQTEESQTEESQNEKDSSDFHAADGSAASVVSDNTAEAELSVDDDAWADMSSTPIADVMAVPVQHQTQVNMPQEQQTQAPAQNQAPAQTQAPAQNQGYVRAQSSSAPQRSQNLPDAPIVAPTTPKNGASADECSMDDASLEASNSVSVDDLKQMFEVKTVEEFAATDPKNPKNASNTAKKKQEE